MRLVEQVLVPLNLTPVSVPDVLYYYGALFQKNMLVNIYTFHSIPILLELLEYLLC